VLVVLGYINTQASLFLKIQNDLRPNCKIFGHLQCVGSIDFSSYIETPNLIPKFQDRFWVLGKLLDKLYVKILFLSYLESIQLILILVKDPTNSQLLMLDGFKYWWTKQYQYCPNHCLFHLKIIETPRGGTPPPTPLGRPRPYVARPRKLSDRR